MIMVSACVFRHARRRRDWGSLGTARSRPCWEPRRLPTYPHTIIPTYPHTIMPTAPLLPGCLHPPGMMPTSSGIVDPTGQVLADLKDVYRGYCLQGDEVEGRSCTRLFQAPDGPLCTRPAACAPASSWCRSVGCKAHSVCACVVQECRLLGPQLSTPQVHHAHTHTHRQREMDREKSLW